MLEQFVQWALLPLQKALATSVLLVSYTILSLFIEAAVPKFKEWVRAIFLFVVVATVGQDVLEAFAIIEKIAKTFSQLFIAMYPLLATSLLFSGSILSFISWHPILLFFVQTMILISSKWLIPTVGLAIVFDFASALLQNISFYRLAELMRFTVLSIVSACVIIYTILMSISGVTMLTLNKAIAAPLKKVVEQAVPLVGSFVVEGFSMFNQFQALTSSWVGGGVLVIVWTVAFLPTLQLVLMAFTFKYLGAILEPISYGELGRLLDDVGKSLFVLCGVSFLLAFAFVFTCLFLFVMAKMMLGGG